jgi:hypothetical protein
MRPALLRAYRKTCFEAAGIEVRIGRRCVLMDRLLASHGAHGAVFITAYNPFSRVMPSGWNWRMQGRLRQTLWRRQVLCGTGSWRRWSEAHLLVFGDPQPMRKLARRYRQYGIVIVHAGQPARLVLTF